MEGGFILAIVRELLWAKRGVLTLPGKTIPFWGYSLFNKDAQVPGPIIAGKVGDVFEIALLNTLINPSPVGESVSIMFPGLANVMAAPFIGSYTPVQPQFEGGELVSFTNFVDELTPAVVYRFQAQRPGIFLYQSGTNSEKQVQLGLYGVIAIRPEGNDDLGHANYMTAYGADSHSGYDVEKIIVLGELDSAMHENVISGEYYDVLGFKPDFWVLNGRCYPDTLSNDDASSQPYGSKISCLAGERVLLRILNAGFYTHTFYLGGLVGRIIAKDSYPLARPGYDRTYEKNGYTLGPGQSVDFIITPGEGDYYLFSREYNHLVNGNSYPGGMLTKLEVTT